jgi:hypothetical protein
VLRLQASPLIGIQLTLDLLTLALNALLPGLGTLQKIIQDEVGEISEDNRFKAYIDLVFAGSINILGECDINTVNVENETSIELDSNAKISVALSAGIYVKATTLFVVNEAEVSGRGVSSITFGGSLNFRSNDGLYYCPYLYFDGLVLSYVLKCEVGLKTKKISWFSRNIGNIKPKVGVNFSDDVTILKRIEILSIILSGVNKACEDKEPKPVEFKIIEL